MQGKITVRANQSAGPASIELSDGERVGIDRKWRVYCNGQATDAFVILPRRPLLGMTVTDWSGRMLTGQHVGITPGDLARLVAPRLSDDLL